MPDSTPDLTGINPSYGVIDDLFSVFMASQVIDFGAPVYLNSIVIGIVGAGGIPFVLNTDWEVATEDFTAESKMRVLSPSYTARLVRSIRILSSLTRPYQISCNYQLLYQDPIALLQTRITLVENRLDAMTNITALTPATPKLLPRDPSKSNTGNLITTEPYVINTFSGQNLIIPISGSFFADSVVVALPTTPVTTLVRDVDYVIINLDQARTKETTNTSGVYRSILLTRPYAGNVLVTYHAYGGEVTLADAVSIYQMVTNIRNYLGGNSFLTASDIGTNTVIMDIIARVAALEADVLGASSITSATFGAYITTWANSLGISSSGVTGEWYRDSGILVQVP